MSPKVIAVILGIILVVAGLYMTEQYWLNPAKDKLAEGGPELMQPMPDVTLETPDGSVVRLAAQYPGKALVINFWATWCLPCRLEIPFFNQVYNEFKEKDVVFVSISVDAEGWPVVNEFTEEIPIEYPLYLDQQAEAGDAFGGLAGLPITVFVNKEGQITKRHIGISDIDDLRNNIRRMIGEPVQQPEETADAR